MDNSFKVAKGEVARAISILREVALWCEDNEMNMWKLRDLTEERLMAGVDVEDFCVGKFAEADACSMILQWADPLFWPNAKENEAGYIHKLCVRRKFAGMGLSARMVEFAVAECRNRGIQYLRLDTGWTREPLCKLYEGLGFKRVGRRTLGTSMFALYELMIE